MNKVGNNNITVTTLDCKVITVDVVKREVVSSTVISIAVNCMGLVRMTKMGCVFLGIGNNNQMAADPKSNLFFYAPNSSNFSLDKTISTMLLRQPPLQVYSKCLNIFDLLFLV